MTFDERQRPLRIVVERDTVGDGHVRVDAVISVSHERQQGFRQAQAEPSAR
jgi:hypothetical protein